PRNGAPCIARRQRRAAPCRLDFSSSGGCASTPASWTCNLPWVHVSDARPIGMFDSGFGGLTVARAVLDLLPHEDLVYVGDTGRYPYGPRDLIEVRRFARQITRHLVDAYDVKVVVVACNTAAAAALDVLSDEC